MERKLRTCCVCGKQYRFCNRCDVDAGKPVWYFSFCCENCKDIYNIMSSVEDGRLSADEAKKKLEKFNLKDLSTYGKSYKSTFEKINTNSKKEEKEVEVLKKGEEEGSIVFEDVKKKQDFTVYNRKKQTSKNYLKEKPEVKVEEKDEIE